MPFKAFLSTAWPRVLAHAIMLLALGATWALPRAAPPPRISRALPITAAPVSERPLEAMARRARVTTTLPVAGVPVQGRPQPVITSRSVPARAATGAAVSPVAAVYSPSRAGWGNDISWPQCEGAYPSGAHDIGVVGVTGGRPFTSNPCLASQFAWARASRMPGGAQVYVNLELDGTSSGPHHCNPDDHPCRAYDYGWMTITDAFARARAAGVQAGFWWLDVEVGNNWSDTALNLNQATVQGALDAVHARGVDSGVYSSVEQWAQLVSPTFRPGVPTWLAVVGDAGMAPALCGASHSLTGGAVYLVQYDDHQFDMDHVCTAGVNGLAAAAGKRPR